MLEILPDMLIDIPMAANHIGFCIGSGMFFGFLPEGYINSAEKIGSLIKLGSAEKIVAHAFKALIHKNLTTAKEMYTKSNIKFTQFLKPGGSEDKFLANNGLAALFPIAHCKFEICNLIEEEQSADEILGWIYKNIDKETQKDSNFVRAILGALLSQFSTITGYNFHALKEPPLEHQEKEDEIFTQYGSLLQPFVRNNEDNEVALLVEAQSFFNECGLAKGLIARIFEYLYKNKLVTSRAITSWMETSVNDLPSNEDALKTVKGWWDKLPPEVTGNKK